MTTTTTEKVYVHYDINVRGAFMRVGRNPDPEDFISEQDVRQLHREDRLNGTLIVYQLIASNWDHDQLVANLSTLRLDNGQLQYMRKLDSLVAGTMTLRVAYDLVQHMVDEHDLMLNAKTPNERDKHEKKYRAFRQRVLRGLTKDTK